MQTPTTLAPGGDDKRLKRHVGLIGLLFTAVGSIIGSGWLFGALNAAQQAGPASIISWLIGAIMILFIGLTYAELGTMFPLSGGVVRFPHFAFGSFASYTTGWVTWLAAASTAPIEVLAALQYANNYIPNLQVLREGTYVLTLMGYAAAAVLMFLFSLVNVIGIRWFARLNNALVWWKIAIILIVVVSFFSAEFNTSHFSYAAQGGFMPFGWHGVFSSIATAGIIFSYLGFRQGVELAGETDNPSRNVPIAIIGSVLGCAVIYIALQIAFIGALPSAALANGWTHIDKIFPNHASIGSAPLATLSMTLGMAWLALLLYIDAFISPADTGLIYTTITARLSYAMGRNGNAPASLAKTNDHGVPWVSVIVAFVVGLIFFLPFPSWQKLVGFVTSATVLSFGSGPLVLVALRKELPGYKRPFRLPGGIIIPYLAFLSSNLIVYWSGWAVDWKLAVAVLLGFSILIVHESFYHKITPRLDLRAGFWVIPWLGGLTLISWLGSYSGLSSGKVGSNLGILDLATAIPTIAIFSALIMWIAYSMRLRRDRIEEYLNENWDKDPLESTLPSP